MLPGRFLMRLDWSDLIIVVGLGAVLSGLWLVSEPVAVFVGGLLALGWGLVLGMARRH